ncbi:MAG TPA: hydroxyethylthiazole kinase [Candidatus Limnocylindria bacterium]|nr:hydroxyethylthiazole kinase [Candidatus Limnocylindria bacterium]
MSAPVVHCITNTVTSARVADALASLGIAPILASDIAEAADVARRASALVLNCGTPTAARFDAMRAAADAASAAGVPIVLDPVGCGATRWRTDRIRGIAAARRIAVVRGNVAEVASLASLPSGPVLHGVTAARADPETVERVAVDASQALGTIVLATGHGHDVIAGDDVALRVQVGVDVLGQVVGAGDVLSALVGAFLARGRGPRDAATDAHAAFASSARSARACGPGSFWPAFIDALASHG